MKHKAIITIIFISFKINISMCIKFKITENILYLINQSLCD